SLLDEHPRDDAALRTGLMRDQRHPDHPPRERLGLVRRLGDLDAAALSAAARVDLRFYDDDGGAETAGNLARLDRVEGDLAARHRHAMPRQDGFRLILVDFHTGKGTADANSLPQSASTPRRGLCWSVVPMTIAIL